MERPDLAVMGESEEFVLSVTEDGFGRRASAYDFRISKRGGKGIENLELKRSDGATQVAASFTVLPEDQLMMVSDGGQIIRMAVEGISYSGRRARGVTLFRVSEDERVVSVTRLRDVDDGPSADGGEEDGAQESGPTEPATAK